LLKMRKGLGGILILFGLAALFEKETSNALNMWANISCRNRMLRVDSVNIKRVGEQEMAKEDLISILRRLLRTDVYLDFLLLLDEADLRTLISLIRERVDREKH
jgi:hypothetical protein